MTEAPRDATGDGENHDAEEHPGHSAAAEPAPEPTAAPVRRTGIGRQSWTGPVAILALLIVAIAASPFWAPAIMPLLPWGQPPPAPVDDAALAVRLDAIERVASPAALTALGSAEAGLARRLDRLEAAGAPNAGLKSAVAAAESALQRLGQRLDAADAKSAAASEELEQTRRDLARLDRMLGGLGSRVGALEDRSRAEIGAGLADAQRLLALMQLRAAVEAGRPFAAEYAAFAALVQDRPDLAGAAAPFAEDAGRGIAGRAALAEGLGEVAERLAVPPPPARQKWWQEALSRMRGLVTVRRIGAPQSRAEAAVDKARTAFTAGDLSGAIAALGTLSGADAATVRPWLEKARARLAAETVLARLQVLLTARLGVAPGAAGIAPATGEAPKSTPGAAPAKPGAPS